MNPLRYQMFKATYGLSQWRYRRLNGEGVAAVGSLIALGIIGLDTNQSTGYQVFTLGVAIVVVAAAHSFRFRDRLHPQRTLPRFGTVGIPLTYSLTLHNPGSQWQRGLRLRETFQDPRPTYRELCQTPEPGEEHRNRFDRELGYFRWRWLVHRRQPATTETVTLPPIPPRSSVQVTIPLYPRSRGPVHLTGLMVMRPDPLGLFNACQFIPLAQSLWILPHRYPLPASQLLGGRRYQAGGVALASAVGESDEFIGLREYRPGDPLRKIHWKSWAKVGKPMVREEEDEFFVRHGLILDTFQPQAYSYKLEEAIAIAASFACNFQTQESLLDLMFVGQEAYCFTSGRGLGHTDQMLEILAAVGPCCDRPFSAMNPLVMDRAELLSGCICILLTWDDDRQNLIHQLENLRVPLLVLLLATPEEAQQEFDPRVFTSPQTQWRRIPLDQVAQTLMSL